ncbi:putative hydrolase [Maioricimonas rarisocia]|uniref:Putative hydrolase n=1 Tax=Maioricimonas rarisocia TaxID=2528026 RepID=A0A517Z7K3_9PLAN|nr:PHP domain-containing protein [Maioricimonas rarisocia]QDU38456.1 putative hydrolase [Maioricimonas rarisocia]
MLDPHHTSVPRGCILTGLAVFGLLCMGCMEESPPARFTRQIEWIGKGQWLKADTHLHTKFSDGAHTVSEVVARGAGHGCDVLAVTDHADRALGAATPEYAEAIEVARREHPNLLILAGLEWNVPPWDGDEHATVLMPAGPDEFLQLADFKKQFDDYGRDSHDAALADAALTWLALQVDRDGIAPVVIYNHPSRKDARSIENVADLQRWRGINELVIGFSGAPGHQAGEPLGAYEYREFPIDRWDPAAARVGDAWDALLQAGIDVWAARAPSDFHKVAPSGVSDYWPGEFSETWMYVPDRTAAGVLRAFHAGSFFAAHGHIIREVRLVVVAPGLERPAESGEAIEVAVGTDLDISVEGLVPDFDWSGMANRIDLVELIAITPDMARVVAEQEPASGTRLLSTTIPVPQGGLVLRARGRRRVADGPDLMFYTNPIRVVARPVEPAHVVRLPDWSRSQLLGLGLCALAVVSLAVSVTQRLNSKSAPP